MNQRESKKLKIGQRVRRPRRPLPLVIGTSRYMVLSLEEDDSTPPKVFAQWDWLRFHP